MSDGKPSGADQSTSNGGGGGGDGGKNTGNGGCGSGGAMNGGGTGADRHDGGNKGIMNGSGSVGAVNGGSSDGVVTNGSGGGGVEMAMIPVNGGDGGGGDSGGDGDGGGGDGGGDGGGGDGGDNSDGGGGGDNGDGDGVEVAVNGAGGGSGGGRGDGDDCGGDVDSRGGGGDSGGDGVGNANGSESGLTMNGTCSRGEMNNNGQGAPKEGVEGEVTNEGDGNADGGATALKTRSPDVDDADSTWVMVNSPPVETNGLAEEQENKEQGSSNEIPKELELPTPSNGLLIRSKGEETLQSFEFAWAPVAQTTCPLNWTPLTKHEVTYQHIRCHQLQEGENLPLPLNYLLANLDSCAGTMALLIINTKNSYNIEASLPPESEMSPFPILVVTSETGKALSGLLDAGEVEAKIELAASLSVRSEPVKAEVEDSFIEIDIPEEERDHSTSTLQGLQLIVKDEEMCQSFEYEWASIQHTPQAFDWIPLTMHDVTYEHVQCHQMQPEEALPSLMANLDSSPGTKALLLINTENDFVIHQSLLAKDQVSMYPVLVIKSESGKVLTHILEKNKSGTVKIKVDIPTVSARSTESETVEVMEATKKSELSIKPPIFPRKKASKQPENSVHTPEIIGKDAKQGELDVKMQGKENVSDTSMRRHKAGEIKDTETDLDSGSLELNADDEFEDACETLEFDDEGESGLGQKNEADTFAHCGQTTVVPSEPIQNGLQIRVKGIFHSSFTYAWSPVTEVPQNIDWIDIREDESTSMHIRCYWLNEEKEDELSTLMASTIDCEFTAALILVNTKDDFVVDAKFLPPNEKCGFPVAVVQHTVGQTLRDIFTRHNREVQARMEITSVTTNVPAVEIQPTKDGHQPQEPQRLQKLLQFLPGMKPSKPVVELATAVQSLLFSPDGEDRIASEDSTLFVMVMTVFNTFEIQGGDQSEANRVLSMLVKKSEHSFQRDFLLYMAIAYRTLLLPKKYSCDSLSAYLKMCIDGFEAMDIPSISTVLNTFLSRGDFHISVNVLNWTAVSVFWFIEQAIFWLMKERPRPQSRAPLRIFPVMLWITTYLKLNVSSPTQPARESIWFDLFLKDSHRYGLDAANIAGVKNALLLAKMLELHPQISFNTRCIGELLVPSSGKKIRPLCHQRDAIYVLLQFFTFEDGFMKFIVIKLRERYQDWLKKKTQGYINSLSSIGTQLGAVKEGLELLDAMNEVFTQTKWRMEQFDEECEKWLLLLLELVNYDHNPEAFLREFVSSQTYAVTKSHQGFIVDQVVKRTRMSLRKLSVHQFFVLYRDFKIWPAQFLDEYLNSTPTKNIKLSDPTWREFFGEAVQRLPGAHNQEGIHRFLFQIAAHYKERMNAIGFVTDLLKVETPDLFTVCLTKSREKSQEDGAAVRMFMDDLRNFILQNNLKHKLLSQMKEILKSLTSKGGNFQKIILSAILKEVAPVSKDLQGGRLQPSWTHAISAAVDCLKSNPVWVQREPSVRQTFCLDFVNACCTRIPIDSSTFDWVGKYWTLIQQFGDIYLSSHSSKKVLSDDLPQNILSSSVKQYFSWIQKIHKVMLTWKTKLGNNNANYDEIYVYTQKQRFIHGIAQHVSATGVVISPENLVSLKNNFLEKYEQLNILLLKYVPGDSKLGWCSLVSILSGHGVELPTPLSAVLSANFLFPGEHKPVMELVEHTPPPSTTAKFVPPDPNVKLQLSKSVTLTVLTTLIHEINAFLQPISEYLSILAYFKLCPSKIFSAYLRQGVDAQVLPEQKPGQDLEEEVQEKEPVTVSILRNALQRTVALIRKIMNGSATYGEIVAGGLLDAQSDRNAKKFADPRFDVEEEFQNLVKCPQIGVFGTRGLNIVKCLLKLRQLPHYVEMIERVCRQYHLKQCQEDPDFKKVSKWAMVLQEQEEREKLLSADAKSMWEDVQKIFCLQKDASLKCLDLFSKIADSVDFYHFLEQKQFTGTKGEVLFRQQFELVTAQLQHEEYNETVLNHLFAAFKFISPFTDTGQSFSSLMKAVTSLDTTKGLTQLDTVKNNMHLIRLWFSRAEDTLNVSHELDCIFKTGCYHYVFSSHGGRNTIQMYLEYQAVSAAKRPPEVFRQESTSSGLSLDELEVDPEHLPQQEETEMQGIMEQWGSEQITDFVRKLGFVESTKDEEQIRTFLHLNETAHSLFNYYLRLKELGHPVYLDRKFEDKLECSVATREAAKKLSTSEQRFTKWVDEVEQLHNSNEWLLFFRIPKLIALYETLRSEKCDVARIHQEIGFLFPRDKATRRRLHEAIEHTMKIASWKPLGDDASPMEVVGSFLSNLFQIFNRESLHSLPKRYRDDLSQLYSSHITPLSPQHEEEFINVLHIALDFTHSELVGLVLRIYGGPPEPFEMLHCKSSTTEEDVKLFMKRVHRHPRQYLVLEVNHLPFQLQEVLLQLYLDFRHKQHSQLPQSSHETTIHFIETAPSVLREIPWLRSMEHKKEELSDTQNLVDICNKTMNVQANDDIGCIQLVYGRPGDGKTHHIVEKLRSIPQSHQVTIAVHEAFTCLTAIKKLSSLPVDGKSCTMFFNFTVLPPIESASNEEKSQYYQLMIEVGWFFYDLVVLGYVEDPSSGKSFHLPASLSWNIFVEIPSRNTGVNPLKDLEIFKKEVAVLGLLGTPEFIEHASKFSITDEVQLVCKYLKAYETGRIDKLYRESRPLVKFSADPELSGEECQRLLHTYMKDHVKENKITQKVFIHYMERRCRFLDNMPGFNYNIGVGEYIKTGGTHHRSDTKKLGSTLMETMLREVADFCDPEIKESWTQKGHQQLIYDFKDGGGSLGLISLLPAEIPEEDKSKFLKIGVEIPSMKDLYSRDKLDEYLSRALNVPLTNGRLTPIDEHNYVLTLDFTLKMLNIHERYECGVPAIIEGETGVGKTALIEMLSKLWNHSWVAQWEVGKDRILDVIKRKLGDNSMDTVKVESRELCMDTIHAISAGNVSEAGLDEIAQLPHGPGDEQFWTVLNGFLLKVEGDPIFSMLELKLNPNETLADLFKAIQVGEISEHPRSKATAHLLYVIFSAKVRSVFYKLKVHAALKPKHIKKFFDPVFSQAEDLQKAYDSCDPAKKPNFRVPFVTVYLDEINTCSCLGLFKEIITDRTLDGMAIPRNVFIIAACNPHRGDSLAVHGETSNDNETWLKGTYYVRKLHPTLQFLMWDYGSLNEHQELEYVHAKMAMFNARMSDPDVQSLAELIVESQKRMRMYAFEQLRNLRVPKAEICARSSVSQRDIQRVFTFYKWLMNFYTKFNPHDEDSTKFHRRAVMVALGIVYFLRLTSTFRGHYRTFLDTFDRMEGEITFSKAYKTELRWFINHVNLPPGIAETNGLMENVFAIIACAVTHTPLIIVGPPGSSKTLSFNIASANLKGKESKVEIFRETDVFKSLDSHFYQCSRRTTSDEVEKVFLRAVNRQRSLAKIPLPVYCVVFMDEAGLPEDKLESLKVLHYHLDRQEVSFVAISNHILDASKTNRAVSLFRPKATNEELYELANSCVFTDDKNQRKIAEKQVLALCDSYNIILRDAEFKSLFGLRDFIHFATYLRRKQTHFLDAQLVIESLERNFNGTKRFTDICRIFLSKIGVTEESVQYRSILHVLKDSLDDCSRSDDNEIHASVQAEVRYKLIIDPSEDDSLVRLLFKYGVLNRDQTRLYICSDFSGDRHMRVNTISQIRHSVAAGHTILMSQTDEIHESFYDLFNQRFRCIEDPNHGSRFYANIAIGAHSKPCRVDPKFQCVVVVRESDIDKTPAPFLNRFEKYRLTHRELLLTIQQSLPPCLCILFEMVSKKVDDFAENVTQGKANLYGFAKETLDSLMLALLPPIGHEYRRIPLKQNDEDMDIKVFLLKCLLDALRENAGFQIPKYSFVELQSDAEQLFDAILKEDCEFSQVFTQIHQGNALAIVDEALHVLFHGPHPSEKDAPIEIYVDACIVISLLLQWLVRYLCRRLIQLLTPEALAVHLYKIPTVYVQSYLKHQEHFSLKNLVVKQFKKLEENQWDKSVCATKLVCFTRSSPLIRQLPPEFPSISLSTSVKESETFLKEHVFFDTQSLMMCKVSSQHSQSKLEKLLEDFIKSDRRLLFLTASMQDVTKQMVNHLRVIVEEAESRIKNTNKQFVLLLHFPPAMFFTPCYSSLFLQGWDHHYLDSITPATLTRGAEIRTVVDINEWFQQCCCLGDTPSPKSMVTALECMLEDAVPVIASRLVLKIGKDESCGSTNASQRTWIIKDLLLNKGIGIVLSQRFANYWNPQTMVELLQKVSSFTYSRKSTLNITDAIQTTFRSLFFDFLVHMFAKINTDHNLDILLDENCTSPTRELFKSLLQYVPIPDLKLLQVLSAIVIPSSPKESSYLPKFPFFKYVCEAVDKCIDESVEKVNQGAWPTLLQGSTDQLQDDMEASIAMATTSLHCSTVDVHKSKQLMEEMYCKVVISHIKGREKCVEVAVEAMEVDDALWIRYFDDFARHKLQCEITPLTRKILQVYIGVNALDHNDSLSKVVSLHVRLHVHQLDISKVVRVLKPVSALKSEGTSLKPDPTATLALESLASPKHQKRLPKISSFIVAMLFEAFCEAALRSTVKLTQCCKSYLGIMSIPSMEEDILSGLTQGNEPQLNIMHATYLLMQCCSEPSAADVAKQLFLALHKFYFEKSPGKGMCPRLKEVAGVGIDLLSEAAKASSGVKGEKNQCVRSYVDGLFAFFFSAQRAAIHIEDVRWFLEIANKHAKTHFTQAVAASDETSPFVNCISLNIFKLYLSRILGSVDVSKEQAVIPKTKEMIVQVLMSQGVSGSPGPYIPTFYQLESICSIEGSKNALMQQPLAHLYFLTALEQLQAKAHSANFLIRIASRLDERINSHTTSDTAKMLIFIEKQAVVQTLCQQLISFLDPRDPKKIQDLFSTRLVTGVNSLLDDESMGGSNTDVSGHGLVFALHLQRQLKSSSKLIQLLRDDHSTFVRNIHCVKPLQTLIQGQPKDVAHLFPFIGSEEIASELGNLYQQIHQILVEVHNTQQDSQSSQLAIERLISLTKESCNTTTKLKLRDDIFISKWNAFQMLIWLCAYYKFFCNKKSHSKFVADAIGEHLRGLLGDQMVCLLQSFIYPKRMMIERPEAPPVLDENAQRLTITEDLQVVPLQQQGAGKQRDPIFELFNPPADAKEDLELRHALANMVAAVLACPPRSNHLWYHLFAANELNGTHMTGFMFEGRITRERLYDCGVELSPDGTYGRPDYLLHATRGTLSLQSLYLLLWANFGAFCMALITQPDAQEKISGPVISSWQHIRHYCVSQLRSVWWHMNNNLQMSSEELSFFVMKCMQTMIEQSPHNLREGKFHSTKELDAYETMWHERIFTECYESIHVKFSSYCQVWQNTLLRDLSVLGSHFPHFPTEEEFSQSMLASANVSDVTQNQFYVLSKFALMYPRLKAGGALLPDLIQFYQWIHRELAYLVTKNYAQRHGLEEVITKADQKYEEIDLFQLYERVKDGYNRYVEVVGGSIGAGACANVNRNAKIYKINDDTKMLHFLSEELEGDNDWLFIVIEDIVTFHNEFLQDIFQAIASPEQSHVRTCFPEQLEDYVYPTEVNSDVCIVPKAEGSERIREHLQLLRSRYLEPHERIQHSMFDLEKLQEDIIKAYLAGKPLIQNPAEYLRVRFKFRVLRPDTIAMGISEGDLQILYGYLKENFKRPLQATNTKELECEFHSADYHMLTEVASGLRNATEHLAKSLNLSDQPDEAELLQMTLPEFLLNVYGKPRKIEAGEDKKLKMEVLKDIGIQSLTPHEFKSQLACLLSLKLPYLYSTLALFVQWIKDGIYDFHHLPLVMKKHLDSSDSEKLQNIAVTFGGTAVRLQDGLNTFTDLLIHAESHMRKTIAENVQKPISTFLRELQLADDDDDIVLKRIPESVLCQNYVDLRVELRRLTLIIQQKVSVQKRGQPISESQWDELVREVWKENRLKHLRDAATPFEYEETFIYDPSKDAYGFQEGFEITDQDQFVFIDPSDHDELDNQLSQIQPAQVEPTQSVPSHMEKPQETSQPSVPVDKPRLEEMASKLTVSDVSEFLKGIKLADLAELFSENDVDGRLLIQLNDNDLKELGVANGFNRRKIVTKFEAHLEELTMKHGQ